MERTSESLAVLKTCSRCQIAKPATDFNRNQKRASGLDSHCKVCERLTRRKRRVLEPTVKEKHCNRCDLTKPAGEFHRDTRNANGLQSYCKACVKAKQQNTQAVQQKRCNRCQLMKPAAAFSRNAQNSSGLESNCKTCLRTRAARPPQPAEVEAEEAPLGEAVPFKRCPKCNETKPTTEYHRDASSTDGLYNHCRACQRLVKQRLHVLEPTVPAKRCASCGDTKVAAEFHRNQQTISGLGSYCKSCIKARQQSQPRPGSRAAAVEKRPGSPPQAYVPRRKQGLRPHSAVENGSSGLLSSPPPSLTSSMEGPEAPTPRRAPRSFRRHPRAAHRQRSKSASTSGQSGSSKTESTSSDAGEQEYDREHLQQQRYGSSGLQPLLAAVGVSMEGEELGGQTLSRRRSLPRLRARMNGEESGGGEGSLLTRQYSDPIEGLRPDKMPRKSAFTRVVPSQHAAQQKPWAPATQLDALEEQGSSLPFRRPNARFTKDQGYYSVQLPASKAPRLPSIHSSLSGDGLSAPLDHLHALPPRLPTRDGSLQSGTSEIALDMQRRNPFAGAAGLPLPGLRGTRGGSLGSQSSLGTAFRSNPSLGAHSGQGSLPAGLGTSGSTQVPVALMQFRQKQGSRSREVSPASPSARPLHRSTSHESESVPLDYPHGFATALAADYYQQHSLQKVGVSVPQDTSLHRNVPMPKESAAARESTGVRDSSAPKTTSEQVVAAMGVQLSLWPSPKHNAAVSAAAPWALPPAYPQASSVPAQLPQPPPQGLSHCASAGELGAVAAHAAAVREAQASSAGIPVTAVSAWTWQPTNSSLHHQ